MNWLGFSLLALGLWGVWGFLGKAASQHLPSQQVYLLAISGHLVVAGYLLLGGLGPASWQPWGVGAALGAGLAMAVGLLCFFEALAPAELLQPPDGIVQVSADFGKPINELWPIAAEFAGRRDEAESLWQKWT